MTLKANERSVHATITAHSQKNETRNGRQNRHCNLKWSSQVTFQRGHLTTHLNFDHSGFPFALQCQTRNGRQNRNRKWSPQVTFQRGHLTKIPISIRTTISNLIFWDLRCKDLNGLHRSLFKGVISQHTSTLTIQDCLLNSNVRIAFWISMIISSLIFSWMGCTTVSIWGVIGIRMNMLSTWSIWFIHEGDMTHSKMSFSIFPVTWLIHKTCNLCIRTGDMNHSKMSQVTVTWLIRKFEGEMTYSWWWHDWFEKVGGDREERCDTNAMSSPTYSHLPHAKKPVSEKSVTNARHQRNVYPSLLENMSRTQGVIYISP